MTSGPAAAEGEDLSQKRTPFGKRLFERRGDSLVQNSMVEKDLAWEVVQTKHTITPGHKHYNEKSALSKTVRFGPDGEFQWGDVPIGDANQCAHADSNISCIASHSSWQLCEAGPCPARPDRAVPSLL